MSNELSTVTVTEFTVVRVISGVNRTLTETNVLFDGKKAEREAIAEGKLLDQWANGHFNSLLATFSGALGDIVKDNLLGACMNMNAALEMNGTPGNLSVDKPNRVMMALCLGGMVRQLDAKIEKSKAKKLTAKMARYHALAIDLIAGYKAAQKAKEAAPAALV